MRDGMSAFIEAKFFKIRYIFENAPLNVDEPDDLRLFPNVSFEQICLDNLDDLDMIYRSEDNKNYLNRVRDRVHEPAMWLGFIARYDEKPAGCFWMLMPQAEAVLYDSFQTTTDVALFCGAYVTPFYRGRRIYNAMQTYAYQMLKDNYPNRKLVVIVEKNNHASLKSLLRSGFLVRRGKNYLFKLMGRNIISLYISDSGCPKFWLIK